MRFKDKVVLVIGGNSGIGLASAAAFAAEGAAVWITGRDEKTLETAARSIPGARAHRADVADIESIEPVIAAIRDAHGRVDVLFVNAGVGAFVPVREITPALWDQVHGVNVRGAFFTAQKVLPLIARGGAILFTSSIAAMRPPPFGLVYAASKAALATAAKVLAREVVADGIRVNVISPGPVDTPITDRNIGMDQQGAENLRQMMREVVPMKRMGRSDEVARAVLFLCSDDASFITGEDLVVDGGVVNLG